MSITSSGIDQLLALRPADKTAAAAAAARSVQLHEAKKPLPAGGGPLFTRPGRAD